MPLALARLLKCYHLYFGTPCKTKSKILMLFWLEKNISFLKSLQLIFKNLLDRDGKRLTRCSSNSLASSTFNTLNTRAPHHNGAKYFRILNANS